MHKLKIMIDLEQIKMEIAKSIYTHWGIDGDGLKDDNHRLAHEAIEIAEIFLLNPDSLTT